MDLNIINDEEKFLAGKLEGYTLKGGENKFDDKGNPLPYPGCTIICNIPLNTYLSDQIISFQKNIEKFNPKKTYFYLPSSSFHMTLFDCCNVKSHQTKFWPKKIPKNAQNFKVEKKFFKYEFFPQTVGNGSREYGWGLMDYGRKTRNSPKVIQKKVHFFRLFGQKVPFFFRKKKKFFVGLANNKSHLTQVSAVNLSWVRPNHRIVYGRDAPYSGACGWGQKKR